MTEFRCRIIQDGIEVAAVSAPSMERAHAEILHYAWQYAQDGPIEIKGDGMALLSSKLADLRSAIVRRH